MLSLKLEVAVKTQPWSRWTISQNWSSV